MRKWKGRSRNRPRPWVIEDTHTNTIYLSGGGLSISPVLLRFRLRSFLRSQFIFRLHIKSLVHQSNVVNRQSAVYDVRVTAHSFDYRAQQPILPAGHFYPFFFAFVSAGRFSLSLSSIPNPPNGRQPKKSERFSSKHL